MANDHIREATKKIRLIDANAFWESVSTDYWEHFTQCHTTDQIDLMEMVEENLAEQPTVDAVEVVHGRWIPSYKVNLWMGTQEIDGFTCNQCARHFNSKLKLNYCPNCGADMRGDGNG